jgi:hypothetical protein
MVFWMVAFQVDLEVMQGRISPGWTLHGRTTIDRCACSDVPLSHLEEQGLVVGHNGLEEHKGLDVEPSFEGNLTQEEVDGRCCHSDWEALAAA